MPATDLVRPPTSLLGVVDEGRYFALAMDWAETVPDVIWPTSNVTYSAMRSDSAISAVLSACTLPIRRASWAVDPAGCRPEVAQMVADDLGLRVVGDDRPTAARTRGVSWNEHLRAALMYLVYGHAAFELLADVSSGQARLVGLYERTQHTISFIHTTPNGDFGGVSQLYHPDKQGVPEIPADRMVFYSHMREGSNWAGRSLLRPMFANWLLKREMQRVLATSSRRFGMGVPTVEWAAGLTPTPAQIEAAQQAASAARVGDTSGMSMPPGARLVLTGLSGGTPDTLAFIKWLDQQMSKSALAQFIDLGGQSSHGSYALGQSFIDLFTLALAALAEEISDQVTRQAAARIVEWNYGLDEPVPAVVVSDIGTKHEITADSLLQLMQAGAITPDPALEAYIRSAYQLPERSIPWVPPARPKGAGGIADASAVADQGGSEPVAASTGRRRKPRPEVAGQTALPIAAAAEPEPQLDPAHQQAWQDALAELQGQWPDLSQPMVDDLAQQAGQDVDSGDLAAVGTLAVSAVVVAGLAGPIAAAMSGLAEKGAKHVVAEAKAQGAKVTAPADAGAETVGQVAEAIANLIANGYASAAARAALQVAGPNTDGATVADAVTTALTDMGASDSGWVGNNLGQALSAAQAAGRWAAIEAHPPRRLLAVEITPPDKAQCAECKAIAGTRFNSIEEARAAYPMAGYVRCAGRGNCRGTCVGIW